MSGIISLTYETDLLKEAAVLHEAFMLSVEDGSQVPEVIRDAITRCVDVRLEDPVFSRCWNTYITGMAATRQCVEDCFKKKK